MWHVWKKEEVPTWFLVDIHEVKKQLGRPRRQWEDNIKKYLQEIGWGHGLECSGSR
jgi:hypothetical protein